MSTWAWCVEGRHEGTQPKYSKPCPGRGECTCPCHDSETPEPKRFSRRSRGQSKGDKQGTD